MMKKLMSGYWMLIVLIAGISMIGCQSDQSKIETAQEKVKDAREDLKEAKDDAKVTAVKTANAEEWKAFRESTELQIKANEGRIAELKIKLNKPGKLLDEMYKIKIESLEQKNREMRARLDGYEKTQTDWEKFETDFKRDMDEIGNDMDEIGKALKDLSIDNQK